MSLSFRGVSHRFGRTPVLVDVDLDVGNGEIVCLLGPSGSGKSTLLRIAAGLEALQHGQIDLDGVPFARPGNEPAAEDRPVGLVFQEHVLFPHLTIGQNVAFGLHHLPAKTRADTARAWLESVGLPGIEDRYPDTLSGGQQQRVALARSLAPNPRVLLLDEPFASVDATLRRTLRDDTRRVLKQSDAIAIVVTHDAEDAMQLGDRVAVMAEGKVVQVDSPQVVWDAPANRFVAELLGGSQSVRARVDCGSAVTAFGTFELPVIARQGSFPRSPAPLPRRENIGEEVELLIRPTDVQLEIDAKPGCGAEQDSHLIIEDIRFLGDHFEVSVVHDGQRLRARLSSVDSLKVGDRVTVSVGPNSVLVYPV